MLAIAVGGSAAATSPARHPAGPSSHGVSSIHSTASRPKAVKADRLAGVEGKPSSTRETGLANAIAHVSQNLADHPTKGLANALDHLQANALKHEGDVRGHQANSPGKANRD